MYSEINVHLSSCGGHLCLKMGVIHKLFMNYSKYNTYFLTIQVVKTPNFSSITQVITHVAMVRWQMTWLEVKKILRGQENMALCAISAAYPYTKGLCRPCTSSYITHSNSGEGLTTVQNGVDPKQESAFLVVLLNTSAVFVQLMRDDILAVTPHNAVPARQNVDRGK